MSTQRVPDSLQNAPRKSGKKTDKPGITIVANTGRLAAADSCIDGPPQVKGTIRGLVASVTLVWLAGPACTVHNIESYPVFLVGNRGRAVCNRSFANVDCPSCSGIPPGTYS